MARSDSIDWDALEAEEERLYGAKQRNSRRPVQADAAETSDDVVVDAAPVVDPTPVTEDEMPDWDALEADAPPNDDSAGTTPFAGPAGNVPMNPYANPDPNADQFAWPTGDPIGASAMTPGVMPGMSVQQMQQMQQMMAGMMAGNPQQSQPQPQPWGQFADPAGDPDASGSGMRANVQAAQFANLGDGAVFGARQGIELLRDVEVELTVELGSTRMLIKHILGLRPGSVVELNRLAGEPVDIVINKTLIARGEVVVVDEKFAIRVVEIVPPERRLASA